MSDKVKIFKYEGKEITFELENGKKMINATQMAKSFGKRVNDFLRLSGTKAYIAALEKRSGDSRNEILRVIQAGDARRQGTWMNEKLALKFAAWLNPDFEVWIYDIIHDVLTNDTLKEIERLKWYLKKLTDNIDDTRNLLDSIPFQDELRKRIK